MSILTETTLSLADAIAELPRGRNGKPINFSTIFRWALKGILAPDGQRIRLEAVRLGGRWITSHEAIGRFVERLTPQPPGLTGPARTPTQRQRAADRAAKKLESIGM